MKVRSPLATFDVRLGRIERRGGSLVVHSAPGSGLEAEIAVPAGEVLALLWRVLLTPAALVFVLGLPLFWLRERLAGGAPAAGPAPRARAGDEINRPW